MLPFVTSIYLMLMPPFELTHPTPWHEQQVEEIPCEPSLDELERDIERMRKMEQFRILQRQEGTDEPEDMGP